MNTIEGMNLDQMRSDEELSPIWHLLTKEQQFKQIEFRRLKDLKENPVPPMPKIVIPEPLTKEGFDAALQLANREVAGRLEEQATLLADAIAATEEFRLELVARAEQIFEGLLTDEERGKGLFKGRLKQELIARMERNRRWDRIEAA